MLIWLRRSLAQACAELAQQLPCYEDLAATPALGATPRWLVDSVVAARMQFLMGMLAPCAPALPQVPPASLRLHTSCGHGLHPAGAWPAMQLGCMAHDPGIPSAGDVQSAGARTCCWMCCGAAPLRLKHAMTSECICEAACWCVQASCEHVSPFALLYLQHWHAPIAAAAHALCAALIESSPLVSKGLSECWAPALHAMQLHSGTCSHLPAAVPPCVSHACVMIWSCMRQPARLCPTINSTTALVHPACYEAGADLALATGSAVLSAWVRISALLLQYLGQSVHHQLHLGPGADMLRFETHKTPSFISYVG